VDTSIGGLAPGTGYHAQLVTVLANGSESRSGQYNFQTQSQSSPSGQPSKGTVNALGQQIEVTATSNSQAVLKADRVKITPDGRAKVAISCLSDSVCQGTILLQIDKQGKGSKRRSRAKKKWLDIGSNRYVIPAHTTVEVNVRVSSRGRDRAKSEGKVATTAELITFNTLGSNRRDVKTIALLPAQSMKKAKRRAKKSAIMALLLLHSPHQRGLRGHCGSHPDVPYHCRP
jgi:hypothetical protein